MSFKIYHDGDHFDIIDDVNSKLSKFGLKFEFEEGNFDGYDIVHLKGSVEVLVLLKRLLLLWRGPLRPFEVVNSKSELASKLKDVLSKMSQEDFDKEWSKVTSLNLESPSFEEAIEFFSLMQSQLSSEWGRTELTEKLKEMRKWTAENYNPQAANGAITVIDELEAWIRKRS